MCTARGRPKTWPLIPLARISSVGDVRRLILDAVLALAACAALVWLFIPD
jgi:hypothetical protein